jgi:hypothetical protein
MGADPAAKRRADRSVGAIHELIEHYLRHQEQRARPSTIDQTRRNLMKYAESLHPEPLDSLDRAALHRLHSRLTATAGIRPGEPGSLHIKRDVRLGNAGRSGQE